MIRDSAIPDVDLNENFSYFFRGWTPLHAAAQKCEGNICQLITKNVEEKNPTDDFGRTPKELWKKAAKEIQNTFQ